MAKTDLRSAYKQVPVHTNDQHLLGLVWNGTTYIDRALPIGLRTAPKLFSAVADGLAWALQCEGVVNCVHYLDDFFFWGSPESSVCATMLATAIDLCTRLGLPAALNKTVGSATTITSLSIEIDSVAQQLRLPGDKLSHLQTTLSQWETKRHASKHELQMLIGWLSHAAAVVRPGQVFIRQFNDTAKIPRLHH